MHIEIWSDFGCPFCRIAEKRLENALQALHAEQLFTIERKSFELDPSPVPKAQPLVERCMRKYGMTGEKARNWILKICRTAAGEGLDWDCLHAKAASTFDAHRLAKFAAGKGVKDMPARLFKACFKDGVDLGDRQALQAIAAGAGLDEAEAGAMLDGGGFAKAVLADEREAARFGIRSVPYVVIERQYAFPGAVPTATFIGMLKEVMAREHLQPLDEDGCAVCGPGKGSRSPQRSPCPA
jgi:protein disulfide-isomerase